LWIKSNTVRKDLGTLEVDEKVDDLDHGLDFFSPERLEAVDGKSDALTLAEPGNVDGMIELTDSVGLWNLRRRKGRAKTIKDGRLRRQRRLMRLRKLRRVRRQRRLMRLRKLRRVRRVSNK
jgi:hypothetical protein